MRESPWNAFVAAAVGLLAVLLATLPFLEPGTDSYAISLLSLGLLLLTLAGALAVRTVGWDPFS